MKQSMPGRLLLLLGLLVGLSCQDDLVVTPPAKEGAAATGSPSDSGPNRGKVIFSDDFSKAGSGWERLRDNEYVADYVDGEYEIKNAVDRQITRGMFENREASDGDFSVTARKISGPDDIRFGLVGRYADDGFLEASILPDGRCNLWLAYYGSRGTRPVFKPCPAVRRGNEPNELRLVVKGARATFYVNGQMAAELDNVNRQGRRFGIFANSTSAASDVRFDNFALHDAP